ncbi:MAG: DUF2958 domain-containing protein [Dehalococcoidia bacterium]|nr:DUF2958 domain-containing protein [Dehalococcoidia bacterium]
MKLLTQELRHRFPKLGEMDGKDPSQVKVIAKFFDPCSRWTWYATEFDGQDIFFGFVCGIENELGYFSLSELERVRNRLGLGIERDRHFGEHTLAEVMEEHI